MIENIEWKPVAMHGDSLLFQQNLNPDFNYSKTLIFMCLRYSESCFITRVIEKNQLWQVIYVLK